MINDNILKAFDQLEWDYYFTPNGCCAKQEITGSLSLISKLGARQERLMSLLLPAVAIEPLRVKDLSEEVRSIKYGFMQKQLPARGIAEKGRPTICCLSLYE